MSEIEVKEADLSEERGDSEDGGDKGERKRIRGLVDFVADLLRIVVSEAVGYQVSRVTRRIRLVANLAVAFFVLGVIASVVWMLVGVAFLAERFPSAADPLVFVGGVVVGYLVAVLAGLAYR